MDRTDILKRFGANETQCQELLDYNQPRFDVTDEILSQPIPLDDEAFTQAWESYLDYSRDEALYSVLQSRLPQLAFPIAESISTTPDYKNATLKGYDPSGMKTATGLTLESPNDLLLTIHPTPAGRIPVLTPGSRHDFELLVQAFSARNEPISVPASMGACTVTGFNNWDRVGQYKKSWQQKNPGQNWNSHFPQFIKQTELYRDRFIILSQGPYSDVKAAEFDYADEEWVRRSFILRLEHECTHYLTLRLFGSMSNNLFDEIIADFVGICAANDQEYRADWFWKFMGLESATGYRQGARLENYRSDPPLGDGSFKVLQRLVRAAAKNLEEFYSSNKAVCSNLTTYVLALCSTTLEEMASEDSLLLLNQHLQSILETQDSSS